MEPLRQLGGIPLMSGSRVSMSSFGGFESGNTNRWSVVNELSASTERSFTGDWSGHCSDPAGGMIPQAVYILPKPNNKIREFTFYYNEAGTSTGGGLRLYDNSGNPVIGCGTDNPQFMIDGINGETRFGSPTISYDQWIKVNIQFDWDAGDVQFTYTEQDSGDVHTATISPNRTTGVSRIELWNYNNGWGGSGDMNMWFDDISYVSGESNFTTILNVEEGNIESLSGSVDAFDVNPSNALSGYFSLRQNRTGGAQISNPDAQTTGDGIYTTYFKFPSTTEEHLRFQTRVQDPGNVFKSSYSIRVRGATNGDGDIRIRVWSEGNDVQTTREVFTELYYDTLYQLEVELSGSDIIVRVREGAGDRNVVATLSATSDLYDKGYVGLYGSGVDIEMDDVLTTASVNTEILMDGFERTDPLSYFRDDVASWSILTGADALDGDASASPDSASESIVGTDDRHRTPLGYEYMMHLSLVEGSSVWLATNVQDGGSAIDNSYVINVDQGNSNIYFAVRVDGSNTSQEVVDVQINSTDLYIPAIRVNTSGVQGILYDENMSIVANTQSYNDVPHVDGYIGAYSNIGNGSIVDSFTKRSISQFV